MSIDVLNIQALRKVYKRNGQGDLEALREVSISIRSGEFVSIVGPSGCGKTTLLSCIAGLRSKSGGRVLLNGAEVNAPPREMALIFQEYGRTLLPWKTVLENVIFGMENRPDISPRDYGQLAREALRSVGLEGHERSYPWHLSGGQQQRVAIARGLANGPDILLMDEPFASVDAQTRTDLEDLLLKVWTEFSRTILFVTHDIEEAVYLSDRVVVLSGAPCVVLDSISIDMSRPRDQLSTREDPKFLEYRRAVHGLMHRSERSA